MMRAYATDRFFPRIRQFHPRLCLARSIILWSIFATVLFLFLSSSASASPGDDWAFGPDTRVTPEPGYRYGLSVSGDIAVWEEEDFVYLKNLTNADPAQILAGDADKPATLPYIDGNLVAWQQDGKVCWQILGGASSCIESSVYSDENPSPMVSNGRIVWADYRNGNADIYLYDVNTGSEQDIYVGPGEQTEPFMDGDRVVWEDFQNDTSEIMAYNLATSQSLQISDDSNLDFSPSVGGNWVAYLENTGININDVWLYNLGTGQRLLLDGGNFLSWGTPHIEGNLVVWNRWDWHVQDAHSQIYLRDLINGNTYTISDGSSDATHPVISAGRIIWFDDRNRERGNTEDLYYVTADNAQALVDRFRPEFKFMIDENFFPAPIEQLLTADGTSLQKKDDPDYNPIFNPTAHDLANYCSSPDCFIDLWGPSVWTGGGPDSCSINRSFVNFFYKSNYERNRNQFPDLVHARIYKQATRAVIQYWINYYANDFSESFHEGDWELVQIELNSNLQPINAAYSRHDGGRWRPWNAVEGPGSNPIVYVARGSHANYFNSGEYGIFIRSWDVATGNGDAVSYPVAVLPEPDQSDQTQFEWLKFGGMWGEYTGATACGYPDVRDGPPNPPRQASWSNPFGWASCDGCDDEQANGTDTQVTVYSPVDIHLYDAQGRHVGKNASGGIDKQIPGSDYIDFPDLHRKSVIIHGGDINQGYHIELDGTGSDLVHVIVTAPDHPRGTVETLNYNNVEVNPSTKATMELDTTRNYTLSIDSDGDGTSDIQKNPDTSTVKGVDFTPPSQTSDLAVTNTTSGVATLTLTAPGDDDNIGTASKYDLRYSTAPITDVNWKDAIPVAGLPLPAAAGTVQTIEVTGLGAGVTYYFALRTIDDVALESSTSNVVSATTPIPRLTWSMQRVYWANYNDYVNRQLSIDYRLGNNGTGLAVNPTVQASICNPETVQVTTALPLPLVDLAAGSFTNVTLKYHAPTNVPRFTTTTYVNCQDDGGHDYWYPGPLP